MESCVSLIKRVWEPGLTREGTNFHSPEVELRELSEGLFRKWEWDRVDKQSGLLTRVWNVQSRRLFHVNMKRTC